MEYLKARARQHPTAWRLCRELQKGGLVCRRGRGTAELENALRYPKKWDAVKPFGIMKESGIQNLSASTNSSVTLQMYSLCRITDAEMEERKRAGEPIAKHCLSRRTDIVLLSSLVGNSLKSFYSVAVKEKYLPEFSYRFDFYTVVTSKHHRTLNQKSPQHQELLCVLHGLAQQPAWHRLSTCLEMPSQAPSISCTCTETPLCWSSHPAVLVQGFVLSTALLMLWQVKKK